MIIIFFPFLAGMPAALIIFMANTRRQMRRVPLHVWLIAVGQICLTPQSGIHLLHEPTRLADWYRPRCHSKAPHGFRPVRDAVSRRAEPPAMKSHAMAMPSGARSCRGGACRAVWLTGEAMYLSIADDGRGTGACIELTVSGTLEPLTSVSSSSPCRPARPGRGHQRRWASMGSAPAASMKWKRHRLQLNSRLLS